ncbi:hypothetical protein BURPSS13_C0115 [Burkholderia pseudomallei S13]|nr:hypothetical protein BURPSS13_C0115 [Burkholderia pseudomallei S13]
MPLRSFMPASTCTTPGWLPGISTAGLRRDEAKEIEVI